MLYYILTIIFLIVLGLIINILNIRKCSDDYNFIVEYKERFSKLLDSLFKKNKYSNKDYEWLVSNSDKIQYILGDTGIISYKDIHGFYPNYQIIINFMNEVLSLASTGFLDMELEKINWCHNAFLRKMGILDEYRKNEIKKLLNPFYDLTCGIKVILGIPLDILHSIGLISSNNLTKIKRNIIFKILGGIISLLTVVSTIMSIILGWKEFVELMKNILNIA